MSQPSIIPGSPLRDRLAGTRRNDLILGKQAEDWLFGDAGSDTLDGGEGADTMIGGTGNDVYLVDDTQDRIEEWAGEGSDTVMSLVNYSLGAWVENLVLQGTQAIHGKGNELNNVLTGNVADNMLAGNAGNDTLDGGLGNDTLAGGTGDDAYYIDSLGDQIIEYAGEGRDTVRSTVSYTLGAQLEKLVLEKSENLHGHGNNLNNVITGNSGNNHLTGSAGLDTLIGGAGNDRLDGGIDNDSMIGGLGDDTYVVDRLRDAVVELGGQGRDTVQSWISYSLGDHVENLALLGTADLNGSGNDLSNVLWGNAGNNVLFGQGGDDMLVGDAGHDTLHAGTGIDGLIGGTGDDRYHVGILDAKVTILERANEGVDTLVLADITPLEVQFSLQGSHLLVNIAMPTAHIFPNPIVFSSILVPNAVDSDRLELVEFRDGLVLRVADIVRSLRTVPPAPDEDEVELFSYRTQNRQAASSSLGPDLALAMGTSANDRWATAGSAGISALSSLLLAGFEGRNAACSSTSFTFDRTDADAAAMVLAAAEKFA